MSNKALLYRQLQQCTCIQYWFKVKSVCSHLKKLIDQTAESKTPQTYFIIKCCDKLLLFSLLLFFFFYIFVILKCFSSSNKSKGNITKYKKQFLYEDLIYYGEKKSSKPDWPFLKK